MRLKTPTSYLFSLKWKVHVDGKLKGLKSHDYHVMMQQILLLCMQDLMVKGCQMVIIQLCHVFMKLCARIVDPIIMEELKNEVAITLVLLDLRNSFLHYLTL
jgi:hypothetical protein